MNEQSQKLKPSREAIEVIAKVIMRDYDTSFLDRVEEGLKAAYAIDVVALEARVKEFQAEVEQLNGELNKAYSVTLFSDYRKLINQTAELRAENERLKRDLADCIKSHQKANAALEAAEKMRK